MVRNSGSCPNKSNKKNEDRVPGLFVGVHVDLTTTNIIVLDELFKHNKEWMMKSEVFSYSHKIPKNRDEVVPLSEEIQKFEQENLEEGFQTVAQSQVSTDNNENDVNVPSGRQANETMPELPHDVLLARTVILQIRHHIATKFVNRMVKGIMIGYHGHQNMLLEDAFNNLMDYRDPMSTCKVFVCRPISSVYTDLVFDHRCSKERRMGENTLIAALYCGSSLWIQAENDIVKGRNYYGGGFKSVSEEGSAYGIARKLIDNYIIRIEPNCRSDPDSYTKFEKQLVAHFELAKPSDISVYLNQADDREKITAFATKLANERSPHEWRDKLHPDNLIDHQFAWAGQEVMDSYVKRFMADFEPTKRRWQRIRMVVFGEAARHFRMFKFNRSQQKCFLGCRFTFETLPEVTSPAMATALLCSRRYQNHLFFPLKSEKLGHFFQIYANNHLSYRKRTIRNHKSV